MKKTSEELEEKEGCQELAVLQKLKVEEKESSNVVAAEWIQSASNEVRFDFLPLEIIGGY